MPPLMVPDGFVRLLAAFAPVLQGPHVPDVLLPGGGLGAVPGPAHGDRGGAGGRGGRVGGHVAVFHRFFSRARWEPDALGAVVFRLALAWLPADQPLFVLVDDTLARKGGKAIGLGSMHHDPLLSHGAARSSSFGHVWVVLALWVPLPVRPGGAPKGVALPAPVPALRGRPARATAPHAPARRAAHLGAALPDAPRRRSPPAGAAADQAAAGARGDRRRGRLGGGVRPGRTVYVVGDTAYANRITMEGRPANVEVVGRLRLDAALWAPAPAAAPRAARPPPHPRRPAAHARQAAGARAPGTWHRLRADAVRPDGPPAGLPRDRAVVQRPARRPLRYVVVRDPSGRRRDEAFFCTDPTVGAGLPPGDCTPSAGAWRSPSSSSSSPGLRRPAEPGPAAVRRTAPFAGLVYALVVLWAAQHVRAGAAPLARVPGTAARPPWPSPTCSPRLRRAPAPPARPFPRRRVPRGAREIPAPAPAPLSRPHRYP